MLEIKNLSIEFPEKQVLDSVNMSVEKGEIVGVVGESGSGKTLTVLAVMGLLNDEARIMSGSIMLDGKELLNLSEKDLREIRGNDISMIFQEPMTSLNPTMRIGKQVEEALILHGKKDKKNKSELKEKALKALEEVRLNNVEELYDKYPHQLSGGMRQRVMIAMGIICRPKYIICDEPTTALDVTTEKEILALLKKLNEELKIGIIFITHDLKLLKGFANRVNVMWKGKVVEAGKTEDIFERPQEAYTKKLIASIPDRSKRKREKIS